MQENYNLLLERMSKSSGLSKEEVEKKIEARRAKLSGLISKEGAAQIIAAELGIKFDDVKIKIREIIPGMKKVNLVAKVMTIFPVRSFNKNGRSGKVSNFIVADETGNIKVVLWDTNHIDLIETGKIKKDDVIEIDNASAREGEIHLSGFSEFKKSNETISNVRMEKSFSEVSLDKIQEGKEVSFRGIVVQVFPPRFFSVCSACGKKVSQDSTGFVCQEHGKVIPKEKALINLILDDGNESIRSVLFQDQIDKITTIEQLKDSVALEIFKKEILGSEYFVKGSARKNNLFNNIELIVNDLEKIDVDKLITKLESNANS